MGSGNVAMMHDPASVLVRESFQPVFQSCPGDARTFTLPLLRVAGVNSGKYHYWGDEIDPDVQFISNL